MYVLLRWQSNIFWLMGHASTWTRAIESRWTAFSLVRFVLPTFLPFSLSRPSLFVIVTLFQPTLMDRLHTLIADFFGRKTSSGQRFNRCRGGGSRQTFIWAWERGRQEKRKRARRRGRGRVGERGCTRSSASGRESISSPRKNATPPAASLRRLDPLFGIADFFLSLPLFFHSNTSTTVIALSKQSLSPSSRQTL